MSLPGYDDWKTREPEHMSERQCVICGDPAYGPDDREHVVCDSCMESEKADLAEDFDG